MVEGRVNGARVVLARSEPAAVVVDTPVVLEAHIQRQVLQPCESKNHSGWLKSGLQ